MRYRIVGGLREVVICHCGRCRRAHGHVGAYTEAACTQLDLLSDRSLRWYRADGRERGFCQDCGSSLFWRRTGADRISITAGTLDAPTLLRAVAHIFVAGRAEYDEISDGLPTRSTGLDGPG